LKGGWGRGGEAWNLLQGGKRTCEESFRGGLVEEGMVLNPKYGEKRKVGGNKAKVEVKDKRVLRETKIRRVIFGGKKKKKGEKEGTRLKEGQGWPP